MYILAIETTGPVGSVAVIDAGGTEHSMVRKEPAAAVSTDGSGNVEKKCESAEAEAVSGPGCAEEKRIPVKITTQTMSHLKNLIPMIAELLEEENIDKDEICAVAASVGPGSFTGIRIGVSTARALAQAWNVPCISVPTLELFNMRCGRPVCAIFNARRGQVYGACYDGAGKVCIEPGPYMLADMLDTIEKLGIEPVFYGDGVDAYFSQDEFRGRVGGYEAVPVEKRYQTADMTAGYALEVWKGAGDGAGAAGGGAGQQSGNEASGHGKIVGYSELLPDYMRESEAEQRLKDGSLEKMRRAKMEKFMKMAGKQA